MRDEPRHPLDKDAPRIRGLFAGISYRYDLLNRILSFRRDVAWRRHAVRQLRLPSDARALDVCTGTADLALELAGVCGDGGRVVGVDFTPEMLRIGEAKRQRRSTRNLVLLIADTLRLPFEDETFDAVTVAFGLRNLSDLRRGIREMARAVKRGGTLAILEFALPRGRFFLRAYEAYFQRILPRIGAWISGTASGREAYRYLPRSVGDFEDPEELSAILTECGLVAIRREPLTFGVVVLYTATRPALTAVEALASGKGAPG